MNRKRIVPGALAALLAAVLVPFGAVVVAAQDDEEMLERAHQLASENKLKKAADAFLAASRAAGESPVEALLGLGAVYYRMEKYDAAFRTAERVLRLTEEDRARFGAYNLVGISLFRDGNVDKTKLAQAEEALRRAVELGGSEATASRHTLALTLQAMGRRPEALALTRGLLAEAPDDPMADRTRVLHCGLRRELAEEAGESFEGDGPRIVARDDVPVPTMIDAPPPYFTPEARKAGVQGSVVVRAVISREGCVVQAELLEGPSHGLDEVAEDTVSRWVFRPALVGGKAVDVYQDLTINFVQKREVTMMGQ